MNPFITTVLSNLVIATLIAAVALISSRIPRWTQVTYLLWLLVLVKLVTPPIYPINLSLPERFSALNTASPIPPAPFPTLDRDVVAANNSPESIPPLPPQNNSIPGSHAIFTQAEPSETVSVFPPPASAKPWEFHEIAMGLWLLGALTTASVVASRTRRFHRRLTETAQPSSSLSTEAKAAAKELSLKAVPQVLTVDSHLAPMLWPGLLRPQIIFAAAFANQLTRAERRLVFAHELAHFAQKDPWRRWFETAVVCLYWWFPLAWVARRELQKLEDRRCDAWVLRRLNNTDRKQYATVLLHTIDFLNQRIPTRPLPACTFGSSSRNLRTRIEQVLQPRGFARFTRAQQAAIAGFVLAGLSLSAEWSPQQPQPDAPLTDNETGSQSTETTSVPSQSAPAPILQAVSMADFANMPYAFNLASHSEPGSTPQRWTRNAHGMWTVTGSDSAITQYRILGTTEIDGAPGSVVGAIQLNDGSQGAATARRSRLFIPHRGNKQTLFYQGESETEAPGWHSAGNMTGIRTAKLNPDALKPAAPTVIRMQSLPEARGARGILSSVGDQSQASVIVDADRVATAGEIGFTITASPESPPLVFEIQSLYEYPENNGPRYLSNPLTRTLNSANELLPGETVATKAYFPGEMSYRLTVRPEWSFPHTPFKFDLSVTLSNTSNQEPGPYFLQALQHRLRQARGQALPNPIQMPIDSTIYINQEGKFYNGGKQRTLEELDQILAALAKLAPQPDISVSIHTAAPKHLLIQMHFHCGKYFLGNKTRLGIHESDAIIGATFNAAETNSEPDSAR